MKPGNLTTRKIASVIDHSLLRPDLTLEELEEGIQLAIDFNAANATVRPSDVKIASDLLAGSGVPLCTVIGFPHRDKGI
jgi:deoxyribose-phosphate aldolase